MLAWFDDPARYWVVAWGSLALLGGVALLPSIAGIVSEQSERRCLRFLPPWLFVTTLALCFVAFRWPLWFVKREFNPDESMMIAEAITLQHDPLCWRSVDGTTHGPLDSYPLLLTRVVGLGFDYLGARVIGAAMIFLLIYGCYRALAVSSRESLARAAVLPLVCFLSFTTFLDFVHYSSEHVPAMLLVIGFWLLATELARPETRKPWSLRWASAGLLLGAVAMAKLQGVPIAAALLVGATLFDLGLPGISFRHRLQRLAVLAASASCVTLLFAAIAWLSDSWHDAWTGYIVQNLFHAQNQHATYLEMIQKFWTDKGGIAPFAAGCAALMVTALPLVHLAPVVAKRFAWMALVFLAVSVAATLAPGWPYSHYLLFAAPPMGLMAASVWQAAHQAAEELRAPQRWVRIVLLALLVGAAIYPQISARAAQPHPYVGRLLADESLSSDPVTSTILRYAKPGEPLGTWGWMCNYYVSTGMRMATREAHTRMEIDSSPQFSYFRSRYMRDLMRSRPPVFFDAVGPGNFAFRNRDWISHETFKPLGEYIARHYRLMADINGTRVYVRKERLH